MKIQRLSSQMGAYLVAGAGVFAPILMCEQGARKRGLDMKVAAAVSALEKLKGQQA